MGKVSTRILATAVLLSGLAGAQTSAFSAEAIPGQYLVKFRDLPGDPQGLMSISDELGGADVKVVIPELDIALVKPQAAHIPNADVLDRLRARPDVEAVQPNFRYRAALYLDLSKKRPPAYNLFFDPASTFEKITESKAVAAKPEVKPAPEQVRGDDEKIGEDKDLDLANVREGWKLETGSRDIVVAVLDTGVDYNHEDLAANMWHDPKDKSVVGWDFVDNDAKPYDVTQGINFLTGAGNPGHGTHCAGNIGAVGDNSLGTSGVAKQVSLMALRMLNQEGTGDTAAGIKSIDYAAEHGARIISASWGSEGPSEDDNLLKEAIARAEKKGVLFIAAAGNTRPDDQKDADNDNNPTRRGFPASFDLPNIISVAASNQQGKMANFTHFGAKTVHLAAPGELSFSTVPSDRTEKDYPGGRRYEAEMELNILGKVPWNGTSMATPQVAGAAALLLSKHPDWTYAQVKKRLMDTVRPEPTFEGKSVTAGVLDVGAALRD